MSRWARWIPLALIALAVGFLLAYLIPLRETEPAGPTPILVTTVTIPATEP